MFGPHVSRYHAAGKRPSIVAHIKAARQEAADAAGFSVTAVALFVGGPKNREITLTKQERSELRTYIRDQELVVIAHSSYAASPWKGDPNAAAYIREELSVCQEAGIAGLVVHLPKQPIDVVMRYIARLINTDAPDVRIYMETPAVNPRATYYETPKKLAKLFAAIRKDLDPNLDVFGLCVDSAHLWTCGIDLQSYEAANQWLNALEEVASVIPADRVMIHLNDSLLPLGVGPDAHAPLAQGKIWVDYVSRIDKSGLMAFTDYAQRHDTPVILERKPKEALIGDYQLLRTMVPRTKP